MSYLWRWMSPYARLDVVVLALMLVYLFVVVIHVCFRYYFARRAPGINSTGRRTLAAALKIEVGHLKSIAVTAPYLGLAGTCAGILNGLRGGAMQMDAFRAMVETQIAVALIPTVVGIPVAFLATCSYNYLRTRIDLLGGEVFNEGQHRDRHFRGTRRLPPTKQLSGLPAFGLLAAPALALAIAGFMTFGSFHPPTGFYVELASTRCDFDGEDRLIVLRLTGDGKLFLNQEQENWSTLPDLLSRIYSMREYRTLYLLADPGVPFQTVARALDTVESAPAKVDPQANGLREDKLHIRVRLMTPKALNADCLLRPVVIGPGHLVLR